MYKNKKTEYLILFVLIIFLFIHHFCGFGGHFGWDDMEYANLAHQWSSGTFHLSNNHFSYRLSVILFTGLVYKIFGVSDFSSALPALLLSIFILLLVFKLLNHRDSRIVITAIVITTLVPSFIFYSDKLMSDIYVAFGIFVSFYALYTYRFTVKQRSALYALILVMGLFFAFITKEVVVLVLPLLLIMFIYDIIHHQYKLFWTYSILLGSSVLIFYHAIIAYKTGSFFSRYQAIELNAYLNPCSYEFLPFINTIKRIGYELWFEFALNGFLFLIVFIVPTLIKRRNWTFSKPESFWTLTTFILVLSANFMTKSYKAYSPMCIDIRHYLYLVPVLAVSISPIIVRYFYSLRKSWWNVISTILIIFWLAVNYNQVNLNSIYVFYGGMFIILLLSMYIHGVFYKNILWITFIAFWLIIPLTQMYHDRQNGYNQIKPFIEKHFKNNHQTSIVLTDPTMKRIADYMMQWDSSKIRFVSERNPKIPYRSEAQNYYIYHNGLTWWLSGCIKDGPMIMWNYREPYIKLVDSIASNELYSVVKPEYMNRPVSLLQFYNDMEWTYLPYFLSNEHFFDSTISYSGKYSFRLEPQGFSPTLSISFASFTTSFSTKIEVQIQARLWAENNKLSSIVMSVEDSTNKPIFWLGKPIKELIKPCACWQTVKMDASYEIKPETIQQILKIYLWNNDTTTIWIDDLSIRIENIEHL